MTAIAREEALAERRAAQAAARQKARRAEQVQAVSKRCRRRASGMLIALSPSAEDSAADRREAVSSIFRKDSSVPH